MTLRTQRPNSKTLPKHLLEALRDLGGGVASDFQEQTGFKPRTNYNETLFTSNPDGYPTKERQASFGQLSYQAEIIKRDEKLVFSAKNQEIKTKVTILQEEVMKLTKASYNLEKQAGISAAHAPTQPGVYHENFFEKLIIFIRSLTKKIENASVWLATQNAKSKKKPYYWAQVGKSGSRFMLSEERYMATQAG